jgi:hypothetical protein
MSRKARIVEILSSGVPETIMKYVVTIPYRDCFRTPSLDEKGVVKGSLFGYTWDSLELSVERKPSPRSPPRRSMNPDLPD